MKNLVLTRADGVTLPAIDAPAALAFRAQLPGAIGWDRAAHALRVAQAGRTGALTLVPAALPAAWLINATADSRAFAAWGSPAAVPAWEALLGVFEPTLGPEDALALSEDAWQIVEAAVEALCGVPSANVAAVFKVLALLRPSIVPRLDDAALVYALNRVEFTSEKPDAANAPVALVRPYFTWFWGELARLWEPLSEAGAAHEAAILDTAQVLDRLVWYGAWGWKHDRAR